MPSKQKTSAKNGGKNKTQNGSGAPVVAAAVAYSQKQGFPKQPLANKSRRIVNSELIASIAGSTGFAVNKYSVNPGLAATFPWLAPQAAAWQQYRFHKLRFRYVTRTATAEKGSLILSPDYNPVESQPTTEQQASNTMDAVEDVCWKEVCCDLDVNAMFPFGPRKQIRSGNITGDMSVYDACRMFVCTTGEDDTATIGKLWVDYDVELFVPQNSPGPNISVPSRISLYSNGSNSVLVPGAPPNFVLFDSPSLVYDPLGIGVPDLGVFTPAAGTYLVDLDVSILNTVDEILDLQIYFLKNGTGVSPTATAEFKGDCNTSTQQICMHIKNVITFSGSDTFSCAVVVGSTGAPYCIGGAQTLTFMLV